MIIQQPAGGQVERRGGGDENMDNYTFIGSLSNGESVFYCKGKGLAIEKDHQHLVEPSPEEIKEIQLKFNHLQP